MRLLALLLLTACLPASDPEGSAGPPAALVRVASAQPGSLSDRWTVPGDVRALEQAELASGAAGPVTEIDVREGDRVSSGQRLLQVDPGLAAARVASLRAAARETDVILQQSRRDLGRVEQVQGEVLSAAERDAAKTSVETLQARLDGQRAAAREAEVNLSRHAVRAPFDGVISARRVDRGDWVTQGQRVLDLVSVDQVDVRVDASAELASQVAAGDPVLLGSVGGTVASVVPALDPSSRTSTIRLVPDGTDHGLLPGSTVQVAFRVQRRSDDASLVPRDALLLGPVDTKVVRVAEGHADIVTVKVIATTSDQALVSGIEPGDAVVVRGGERLRPGQALKVGEGDGS